MTTPDAETPPHYPAQCPRFLRCAVGICPLHVEWRGEEDWPREPVCSLLVELAQPDGDARVRRELPDELAAVVMREGPEILRTHGRMRWHVMREATRAGREPRRPGAQGAGADAQAE